MDKINIKLNINSKIYLKDPLSTNLGKKIIENDSLYLPVYDGTLWYLL